MDDVDQARARVYGLLAALLWRAPAVALAPPADPHGEIGAALADLTAALADADPRDLIREYNALFIGVGRGELMPYGSFYRTGFLHERPLAELRDDLARLGLARADGVAEPEDHIAFLCEAMATLIAAQTGTEAAFFDRHLRPWAGRFFADLEAAEGARCYRGVGRLGRLTIEIETEAYGIAA